MQASVVPPLTPNPQQKNIEAFSMFFQNGRESTPGVYEMTPPLGCSIDIKQSTSSKSGIYACGQVGGDSLGRNRKQTLNPSQAQIAGSI